MTSKPKKLTRAVSAETRRKMSESQKARWRREHEAARRPVLHINYGHAARSSEPGDKCFYCGKNFAVMAYTYFGAPVCGRHWDGKWRKTEEGACDPPFMAIKHQSPGQFL